MNFNLFDRTNNAAILLAGIIGLIVGVGAARFAFTSLLPFMLEDYLSITSAGLMASFNFVGYLSGAIFSIFLKDINSKIKFFRFGLIISVLTTLILATTTNEILWIISRVIAGFGSAMALIVGGSIVMVKLNMKNKTKAMGIHFSGIGLSIVFGEVITQIVLKYSSWNDVWLVLSLVSIVLATYSIYILNYEKNINITSDNHKVSKNIFTPYVILLVMAYFTEGVGFVVQGTFLPDIINSLDGLKGYGSIGWLIVGLSGVPSSIILMRLAHKYGIDNIIILAMSLQVIGILIPTFTNNTYLNLLSGALYGGTFIGLVALFMTNAGHIAKHNPVIIMGSMTSAYGIGQVSAPLYSVYLIHIFGNYNTTLYLTSFIVSCGIVLLFIAKSKKV